MKNMRCKIFVVPVGANQSCADNVSEEINTFFREKVKECSDVQIFQSSSGNQVSEGGAVYAPYTTTHISIFYTL